MQNNSDAKVNLIKIKKMLQNENIKSCNLIKPVLSNMLENTENTENKNITETNAIKSMLYEINLQVANLSKNYEDSIDPRINNIPLPNDSIMTYKFGARSYEIDCFLGYTWRNGFWYKTYPTLKFHKPEINFSSNIYNIFADNIDDKFYPIMLNDSRLFIREIWKKIDQTRYIFKELYTYSPNIQKINRCSILLKPFFEMVKLKETITKKIEFNSTTIEYEDFEEMSLFLPP